MKLHFRKYGEGQPFIILHGLFGLSDNWQSIGKHLSSKYAVYLVDLRNHGHSAHNESWNYEVMAEDVHELISDEGLSNVILMGHSMGGKTAMKFAIDHCRTLSKLIVVDIAIRRYSPPKDVITALNKVDLNSVSSRKDVEHIISSHISDVATQQFILKNLYWNENDKLSWRFNLPVITREIENIAGSLDLGSSCADLPTLFIRGERSDYINDEDMKKIKETFPLAELKTVPSAGHWVHAENPAGFGKELYQFLES